MLRSAVRFLAGLPVALLVTALLAGSVGTDVAHAAPSLTAQPPTPITVTTAVPFETTVLAFTDAEPGTVPGDAGYVNQLYLDLLGRPLDTTYWTDLLAAGVSRRQVADALARSVESRTRTARIWWDRYLGRVPADLPAWADALAGSWTVEHARAVLLGSAEYRVRIGGTNQAFVDALFREALGRPVDPAGAAFFDSLLVFGIPHVVVADYVLASPEARRVRAAQLVQQHLRRPADAGEVDRHAATLAAYGEAAAVVGIVTEAEYDRLQPSTYRATIAVDGGPPTDARVLRRLDGSFAVVAPVRVTTAGAHTASVVVTRSTGEQLTASVPIIALRARNENYLDAVAIEILGRPLSADELSNAMARMPAGGSRTRSQVALSMMVGEESRQRVAAQLYRQLLGREPGPGDAQFWAGRIATSSVMVARALILGSDEVATQAGGSNAGWIDLAFRRALGRGADPGALAYWQSLLATGLPRPYVAYAILMSQESRQRIAAQWTAEMLGRTPTPGEAFLGGILAGIPPYELGFPSLLLGGDDFYATRTGTPG